MMPKKNNDFDVGQVNVLQNKEKTLDSDEKKKLQEFIREYFQLNLI